MVVRTIVMIGAGNVATQLALTLFQKNLSIIQVFSRTALSANTLAQKINAEPITRPGNIIPDADLYIIAVSDDAIAGLAKDFHFGNHLVVHTSGTISMDVLKNVSAKYGVFYPLQTFSKERKADFTTIPVLIEASDNESENILVDLGKLISETVLVCDSEKRKIIHLSAVFACNFSNFMFTLSGEILASRQLSFDLLRPLIMETAAKVMLQNPALAQTGPAKRNDLGVMATHKQLLANDPDKLEIYSLLSKLIFNIEKEKNTNG